MKEMTCGFVVREHPNVFQSPSPGSSLLLVVRRVLLVQELFELGTAGRHGCLQAGASERSNGKPLDVLVVVQRGRERVVVPVQAGRLVGRGAGLAANQRDISEAGGTHLLLGRERVVVLVPVGVDRVAGCDELRRSGCPARAATTTKPVDGSAGLAEGAPDDVDHLVKGPPDEHEGDDEAPPLLAEVVHRVGDGGDDVLEAGEDLFELGHVFSLF